MANELSDSGGESIERRQSQDCLSGALNKAIDYHVLEYKMTYDEVIGCLEIIKLNMWREYCNEEE